MGARDGKVGGRGRGGGQGSPPRPRRAGPARSGLALANGRAVRAAVDNRARPIGVFDSGIGGLTVLKALAAALPHEDFIYLGDTARLPYGTKSREVIVQYSRENTGFLLAKGIKMLVIACNTASAVALEEIARDTVVPVIGVIEPGARAAVAASRSGKIGVIGTEATIASGAYTRTIQGLRAGVELYTRACPLLVPLVEEGWTEGEVAERTVAYYLESLKQSGIDTLLLGCTHYPLLSELFRRVLGAGVRLVDSASATAAAVRTRLGALGLMRREGRGALSFFITESPDRFVRVGRRFLGPQVDSAVRIER
ncbi:MAG TPA: glutamate racemase [Candidatus Binataceae bacterium]|nr:glutamate racemase [Candidatus Binataceae bacterium]